MLAASCSRTGSARADELIGLMLAGGPAVVAIGNVAGADTTGYLLGMPAPGVGSVPFCRAVGRTGLLPGRLARWGVVGYTSLAAGALLELVTGQPIAMALAIPGGLFELVLGVFLLRRGFGPSS